MKRQIIHIDEEKCDGCGLCIPNCHEGALQVIDGKARLVSDLFCDGLGACIGHCPQGAITLEQREAAPYNERLVMEKIVSQGKNTILAHLKHLKDHNEDEFIRQALDFMKEKNITLDSAIEKEVAAPAVVTGMGCGCSGSMPADFSLEEMPTKVENVVADVPSELRQWPIQMHLINPAASYFRESELLLASDCSAFTMGNFHNKYIRRKSVIIACPKLDQGKEIYLQKLVSLIRDSKVKSITVVMMEVPCCGGLSQLVNIAMQQSGVQIPVKNVIMSIRGDILREN